jgi:hypothetical protein
MFDDVNRNLPSHSRAATDHDDLLVVEVHSYFPFEAAW